MPEEDLTSYYDKIKERGWGCWVHGVKQAFAPITYSQWEKKTQKVGEDRQVTICWDPSRYTDVVGDLITAIEVYRNTNHHVLLFPVLVA